jgi:hypothetical protein
MPSIESLTEDRLPLLRTATRTIETGREEGWFLQSVKSLCCLPQSRKPSSAPQSPGALPVITSPYISSKIDTQHIATKQKSDGKTTIGGDNASGTPIGSFDDIGPILPPDYAFMDPDIQRKTLVKAAQISENSCDDFSKAAALLYQAILNPANRSFLTQSLHILGQDNIRPNNHAFQSVHDLDASNQPESSLGHGKKYWTISIKLFR